MRDGTGEVQVMLSLDRLGEESLAAWKSDVDLGDHVGVEGEVISSKRGELSVLADRWAMVAKALRPLPDKHKGLTDPEARVRLRYVDLAVNAESRQMIRNRADRAPVGARDPRPRTTSSRSRRRCCSRSTAARPRGRSSRTSTRSTSRLYLRIASSSTSSGCVVGGIERVFEIGRNFRNEGVDATHNPEFTMLEVYQAYGDYNTMATLTREIVLDAARALGSTVVPDGRGGEIDLEGEWRHLPILTAVSEAVGEQIDAQTPAETLRKLADRLDVALQPSWEAAEIVVELYEQLVEDTLLQPTFVTDYPAEVKPLAKPHRTDAAAWSRPGT